MKKMICLIAAVAGLCVGVAAQETEGWTRSANDCELSAEEASHARYAGSVPEGDCWLTRSAKGPKSFVRRDDWQVVLMDRRMRVVRRLELPQTHRSRVLAMRVDDGGSRLCALFVDSSEASRTTLTRAVVEMDSMALVGGKMDTLATYDYAGGDRCLLWCAESENGRYTGVLTVVEHRKEKTYASQAVMLDEGLELLWKRDYAVETTSSIGVSDEGELITLGDGRDEGMLAVWVSVIAQERGQSYEMKVESGEWRVEGLRVLRVAGRRVLGGGLYGPLNADIRKRLSLGVVTMGFALDTMGITAFDMRPFGIEAMNVMDNERLKKRRGNEAVAMAEPIGRAWTDDGGVVMAIGHRHAVLKRNANGTVDKTCVAQGVHLVAMDSDGNWKWGRSMRRNDVQKENADRLYTALFSAGGKVHLVKNESRKLPSKYDIEKAAKEYEVGEKGNLVVYSVDDGGEVEKTVLRSKTKYCVTNAAKRDDGSVVLLTADGKKMQCVELR